MATLARIDDEQIGADDFITQLKLNDAFDNLLEDILIEKLTVVAARKHGISVSDDEIQQRFDQIRRVEGLHRTQDTLDFLENMKVSLDQFEQYITETIFREKMHDQLTTDEAVNAYFNLHSPRFESVDIGHILLDSEDKAREMIAYLEDDPDGFEEMARENSMAADAKENGGLIGKIDRGSMDSEIEAKVFNAESGDVLGPFASDDGLFYEIFRVNTKYPAVLDDATAKSVRKLIIDEWLRNQAQEHRVEVV